MISITHYEVYSDRGDGWKLEERFASDQRYGAINLAKEKEAENLKVKIIKETFDVQDNSYQETVEYVSNLGGINKKSTSPSKASSSTYTKREKTANEVQKISVPNIFKALLKLIMIIVLCLLIANILITLLVPIIKNTFPEDVFRPILFVAFFVLFLSIAIPLLLKKVPWHIFMEKHEERPIADDRKFLNHAETIYKLYNLNDDFETNIAPVFPEAPFEYKQYIVSFLQMLLANIDSRSSFADSFSRLGIKLIIYGGCIELCRNCGLRISEANSLLYEAFKVLDGEKADLVAFYEAKKTYKDNKNAIFLCGIGAYLMTRIMNNQPLDTDVLKVGFIKWENQNSSLHTGSIKEISNSKDIPSSCVVNIKSDLHFLGDNLSNEEMATKISHDIHNIIQNLLNKYAGENLVEDKGVSSINFALLNEAIKFATSFLQDISIYQDEINDENIILKNMCAITEIKDTSNPAYIDGIFDHAYDGEVLITKFLAEKLAPQDYTIEFLGEKKISNLDVSEEIYKIIC